MKEIHSELIYSLEVRSSSQPSRKLDIYDQLLAGLDPRNDLVLVDPQIAAKHFLFKTKDGLLTVQFLGADNTTFLNNLPLENGKLYMLEMGDKLKCGRVEIRIRREMAPIRAANLPLKKSLESVEFLNVNEVKKEEEEEKLSALKETGPVSASQLIEENKIVPKKNLSQKKSKNQISLNTALKKMPLKFYGFLFDLSLTYFTLAFIVPVSGLLESCQSLLYPMTEFFTKTFLIDHPEFSQWKILSLGEFFIVFHLIMITFSLVLGNTPGAWLIGLQPANNSVLSNRFKAYLYCLLNVVALPLIVFDLPLLKGRTLKELLTFYDREIKTAGPYKFTRTSLVPALIVLFSLAPIFLKYPYSAVVVEEKLTQSKIKDVHTQTISSASSEFGVALKTELNSQYSIFPYLEQNKIGLTLYERTSGQSLVMQELWRMKTDYALFKLRFSNPLSSLYLPNDEINNELLKTKALEALKTTPLNFFQGIKNFGLYFGNAVLFKQQFLQDFAETDSFLAMPYHEKDPFLLVSSHTEEILFWFARNEIIAFKLTVPKQTRLLEHFNRDILAGMRFNQAYGDKLKTPQILEAIEAFERENYQTLLTYYVYEAKKSLDPINKKDTGLRAFLKKNILQTKLAINGARNKNIEKSFDDVINQLQ